MRRQILTTLSALALTSSLFVGVTAASAGGGVPLPQPIPAELYIPENCEIVQVKGGVSYAHCELPPECELVELQGRGGISVSYIECDLEPGCTLENGSWMGVTYWYVDCDEPECIGGCYPVVPFGVGLKN